MAGSRHSDESDSSSSSVYSGASIGDQAVELHGQSFEGPPLPRDVESGFYDVNDRQFYTIDRDWKVVQFARDTGAWVLTHKKPLLSGIADLAPSGGMGVAPYIPGLTGKVVNAGSQAAQGLRGAKELYDMYMNSRAGAHIDPVAAVAIAGRLVSVGANVASGLTQGLPSRTLGGIGTGAAWAASAITTADAIRKYEEGQGSNRNQVYMHAEHPPVLGSGAGQIPPGWNPPLHRNSSTSSMQRAQESRNPVQVPVRSLNPDTPVRRDSDSGPENQSDPNKGKNPVRTPPGRSGSR
jgi:hypothetical protein